MRDTYSLELNAEDIAAGERYISPEIVIVSSVIYALTLSLCDKYYALMLAGILPVFLLFSHKISLLRLNAVNFVKKSAPEFLQ